MSLKWATAATGTDEIRVERLPAIVMLQIILEHLRRFEHIFGEPSGEFDDLVL